MAKLLKREAHRAKYFFLNSLDHDLKPLAGVKE